MMKKILCLVVAFGLMCQPCYGVTNQWREDGSQATMKGDISVSDIDAVSYANIVVPVERMLSKYKSGCDIRYASASTLTVTAGEVMLSNAAGTNRLMQQNTTNTTVTWANIDTPAEATATTYYVYAYQNTTSTFTFNIFISTSSSAPSGATYYLKLGSFYNNASGNIEQITNENEELPADARVKGWVNFDGTGDMTPRDSFNVSSITDNGTGIYTINWNTDFSNNNYAVVGSCGDYVSPASRGLTLITDFAVGSTRVTTRTWANDGVDSENVCVIVIGDQ